jgi:hypothetical protein
MEILVLYLVAMLIGALVDRVIPANPTTLCLDCANAQFVRKAYANSAKTYCKRNGAIAPVKFAVVECSDYIPRTAPKAATRVCGFACSGCTN